MPDRQLTTAWPSSIDRCIDVLSASAPHLAGVLAPTIDLLTTDLQYSGQLGHAWQNSLLGYNRMPLEFTVSTLKPEALYCTVDPFPKKPDQHLAIDALLPYYQRVAAALADPSWWQRIRVSQANTPLRFGSWLGLKYTDTAPQVKVYSEIPDQAAALEPLFPQGAAYHQSLKALGLKLLMLGYYPHEPDRIAEAYYVWEQDQIDFSAIERVMDFFDCSVLAEHFLPFLKSVLRANTATDQFPQTTYGFSLTYQPDGLPETFTLFTMAPSFFGENEAVPYALKELLVTHGWSLPHWDALLTAQQDLQYNVLGFSVAYNGYTGLNCTFSPQPAAFVTKTVTIPKPLPATDVPSLAELLTQHQLPSGAFAAQVYTPDGRWHQDSNAFVTAQVLRLLIDEPTAAPFVPAALDFLETCVQREYKYGFWPLAAHPHWMGAERLPADIDDTALVTEVLYRYGRLDDQQLLNTISRMNNYTVNRVDGSRYPWIKCYAYHTWMETLPNLDQLDCCANTNALAILALAGREGTPHFHSILRMLEYAVSWGGDSYQRMRRLIPYYAHPHEWVSAMRWAADQYQITALRPLISKLEANWGVPALTNTATPLYCRHDGAFMWVSTLLSGLRQFKSITIKNQLA